MHHKNIFFILFFEMWSKRNASKKSVVATTQLIVCIAVCESTPRIVTIHI